MEEYAISVSVEIPAPAYRMAKAQAAKCGANLSVWIGAAIVAYAAQTDWEEYIKNHPEEAKDADRK